MGFEQLVQQLAGNLEVGHQRIVDQGLECQASVAFERRAGDHLLVGHVRLECAEHAWRHRSDGERLSTGRGNLGQRLDDRAARQGIDLAGVGQIDDRAHRPAVGHGRDDVSRRFRRARQRR